MWQLGRARETAAAQQAPCGGAAAKLHTISMLALGEQASGASGESLSGGKALSEAKWASHSAEPLGSGCKWASR
jgi:hypothetical protein